ncbi:MAG: hypothetical protein QM739_04270 [Propionivibrio sp.]
MFNTTNLPLPTAEQIRDQRHDQETMHLLLKLRDDLAYGIRKLAPESLLALARQYHPEAETDYQAAAMLGLEAMDVLRALAQHGEDVSHLSKAEADRLAPMVAEAARRALAIPMKLDGLNNEFRSIDAGLNERRENLIKAGVRADEIERLIANGAEDREARRAELNSKRQALLSEFEALDMFMQTRDEKHLPEGFNVSDAPPRITGHDAMRHSSTR